MIGRSLLFVTVALAVVLFPAKEAAAQDGEVARIWLDAEPQGCLEHWAPLTRNVTLACEATGGKCVVAPSKEAANRFVYLRCDGVSNNPIKIEGRSADNKQLRWSADLLDGAGPSARIDDRIRAASVFAARFETQETSRPPTPTPASSQQQQQHQPTTTTTSSDGRFHYAPSSARPDDDGTLGMGLTIGGFGVAAAGLIVGIPAVIAYERAIDDLQACRPSCQESDVDSVTQKSSIANVALLTAGVGAVVGVVGLFLWPSSSSSTKSKSASTSTGGVRLGVGSLSGSF